MEYKYLGRTDIKVSRIGYGCMSLKEENPENRWLLQKAWHSGINYFDTADIYSNGDNEKLLANALAGIARDKYVLATKVGNIIRPNGTGLDWNPSKAHILSAVETSLQRLKTDYIDLYQLHGGTLDDNFEEIIAAFEQLKKEGKIRAYGISSIRPTVIKKYAENSQFQSLMSQYSLLDRRPEEQVFPLTNAQGIGVMVRGSVAGGLLVNKPPHDYLDYNTPQVAALQKAVQVISYDDRTPAQTATQFVLKNSAVTTAVVGISTKKQLQEAVTTFDVTQITAEERQYLISKLPPNFYAQHRL